MYPSRIFVPPQNWGSRPSRCRLSTERLELAISWRYWQHFWFLPECRLVLVSDSRQPVVAIKKEQSEGIFFRRLLSKTLVVTSLIGASAMTQNICTAENVSCNSKTKIRSMDGAPNLFAQLLIFGWKVRWRGFLSSIINTRRLQIHEPLRQTLMKFTGLKTFVPVVCLSVYW